MYKRGLSCPGFLDSRCDHVTVSHKQIKVGTACTASGPKFLEMSITTSCFLSLSSDCMMSRECSWSHRTEGVLDRGVAKGRKDDAHTISFYMREELLLHSSEETLKFLFYRCLHLIDEFEEFCIALLQTRLDYGSESTQKSSKGIYKVSKSMLSLNHCNCSYKMKVIS